MKWFDIRVVGALFSFVAALSLGILGGAVWFSWKYLCTFLAPFTAEALGATSVLLAHVLISSAGALVAIAGMRAKARPWRALMGALIALLFVDVAWAVVSAFEPQPCCTGRSGGMLPIGTLADGLLAVVVTRYCWFASRSAHA